MEIYLKQDGERAGPFTLENVQGQLEAGQLTVSDAAWFEGCEDWVTVQGVPGIMLPGGDHLLDVATVPPFDAYEGEGPYVFVSYAHKDAAIVYEEITHLHEAGVNVWYDEGIEASNEWPEEIANAVIDCAAFLAFVSPRATASVNCRNEINLALNENKPFLAIYLEETGLPPGLRLRMGDLQAILRYKLPVDRYQRKAQNALDQLLGKKPAKKRKTSVLAQQTQATASSKPRRKGLAVALASVFLIACGALGYVFLGDDGVEISEISKPETTTATFTPGQPWTAPSASIEMIWCKPGTFMMGSPEGEAGRELDDKGKKTKYDETQHQVTLTKGFYLGKYEVTQAQWEKVMGTSPSKFLGDDHPMEQVSWTDSKDFCWNLTLMERKAGRLPDGWEYTLPTEAQWEYACRAGTTTVFAFGDSLSSKQANFNGTKPYGGAAPGSFLDRTSDVGSYATNPWGFHDMHGNVGEWCADWIGNYPTGSVTDPTGPASGSDRVQRGDSWDGPGAGLRSAKRNYATPGNRDHFLGFRVGLRLRAQELVFNWQPYATDGKPSHTLHPRGLARAGKEGVLQLSQGAVEVQGADEALFDACMKSGQLTIEAVIGTASLEQSGPARIVTFSVDGSNRNFTLGQDDDKLILRLRTPQTGLNASNPQLTLTTLPLYRAVHVTVTYQSDKTTCYVDGKKVIIENKVRGDFSNWVPCKILFGDEVTGERDWQGMLDGVSLYSRVLTEVEVQRRAAAYRKARGLPETPAVEGPRGAKGPRSKSGQTQKIKIER